MSHLDSPEFIPNQPRTIAERVIKTAHEHGTEAFAALTLVAVAALGACSSSNQVEATPKSAITSEQSTPTPRVTETASTDTTDGSGDDKPATSPTASSKPNTSTSSSSPSSAAPTSETAKPAGEVMTGATIIFKGELNTKFQPGSTRDDKALEKSVEVHASPDLTPGQALYLLYKGRHEAINYGTGITEAILYSSVYKTEDQVTEYQKDVAKAVAAYTRALGGTPEKWGPGMSKLMSQTQLNAEYVALETLSQVLSGIAMTPEQLRATSTADEIIQFGECESTPTYITCAIKDSSISVGDLDGRKESNPNPRTSAKVDEQGIWRFYNPDEQ